MAHDIFQKLFCARDLKTQTFLNIMYSNYFNCEVVFINSEDHLNELRSVTLSLKKSLTKNLQ